MSHRSVRFLIRDAAKSLSDAVQYGYGRRSDFDLITDKRNEIIWLLPLTASPGFVNNEVENYQKTWNAIMVFLVTDRSDSNEDEYAVLLDDTDELVDKFINRLNDWSMKATDTVGAVTLRNFQQINQIKMDAGIFTGWFLSFQIIVSNDFTYCTPENVELYANS